MKVVDLEWESHNLIEEWREACEVEPTPVPIKQWATTALRGLRERMGAATDRTNLEIQVRALGRWAGLTHHEQTQNRPNLVWAGRSERRSQLLPNPVGSRRVGGG